MKPNEKMYYQIYRLRSAKCFEIIRSIQYETYCDNNWNNIDMKMELMRSQMNDCTKAKLKLQDQYDEN